VLRFRHRKLPDRLSPIVILQLMIAPLALKMTVVWLLSVVNRLMNCDARRAIISQQSEQSHDKRTLYYYPEECAGTKTPHRLNHHLKNESKTSRANAAVGALCISN
jgi:hypothetical protein